MKVLLAALGSPGFLYPLVSVAKVLERRGHSVAFATDISFDQFLSARGFARIPRGHKDGPSFTVAQWSEPLCGAIQLRHLEHACKTYAPDIILSSHLTLGPLVMRELYQTSVAVLGSMIYLWPASSRLIAGEAPQTALEERLIWRHGDMLSYLNKLRAAMGLAQAEASYAESPLLADRYYVQGVPPLQPECDTLPEQVEFVGHCLLDSDEEDIPRDLDRWLTTHSEEPLLYVNCGRTFDDAPSLPMLFEWIKDQPIAAVVCLGRYDGAIGEVPENVFCAPEVPHDTILRRASAVVCSGHPSAVLGAIKYGLPMLVLYNGSGTDDIGEHCSSYGCAIAQPVSEMNAERIGNSLGKLLTEKRYRAKAQELKSEFAAYDGPTLVARDLEQVYLQARALRSEVC